MRETKTQREARVELAKRRDNVTWRNNTGKATHYKGGKTCPTCKKKTLGARVYTFPYGLSVGSADLISCVPLPVFTIDREPITVGAFVAIEMKRTKGGIHQDSQKQFGELVKSFGGHYGVARSGQDACGIIDQAKRLDPWIKKP